MDSAAEGVALPLRLALVITEHPPRLVLGSADGGLDRSAMSLHELHVCTDGLHGVLERRAPSAMLLVDRFEPLLQLLVLK